MFLILATEPKVDLSGLKESKDDIMPLLQECGWQK